MTRREGERPNRKRNKMMGKREAERGKRVSELLGS